MRVTFINYKNNYNSMKKGILLLSILFIFILPLIDAEQADIGCVKQGSPISLKQSCANCTYVNISSIYSNTGYSDSNMYKMQQIGISYNYTFSDTNLLGDYTYDTLSDPDGEGTVAPVTFHVTTSGNCGNNNLVFYIFIIIGLYALNLFGFFGKNEIMTILGGMALIFLGVYIINNGIIIFRDTITNYIAYLTIAWGAISSIWAGFALFEDL